MGDQGLWWKLWCSALDDPDLDNLEIGDFGRYCKLGAFVKRHGDGGTLTVSPPARGLCAMLQVPDFPAFIKLCQRLPNMDVRGAAATVSVGGVGETTASVAFLNWQRYQGDYSTARVRRHRAQGNSNVTDKRRGDEKRGDKRRREEIGTHAADAAFIDSLKANPAYDGINIDVELGKIDAWLSTPAGRRRQKTRGFIVNWLNRIDRPVSAAPTPRIADVWKDRPGGEVQL